MYKLIRESDGTYIEYSFSDDVDLTELLQNITYFMQACSWSYVESLQAITNSDDESDVIWRREHAELMEAQEKRIRAEYSRRKNQSTGQKKRKK